MSGDHVGRKCVVDVASSVPRQNCSHLSRTHHIHNVFEKSITSPAAEKSTEYFSPNPLIRKSIELEMWTFHRRVYFQESLLAKETVLVRAKEEKADGSAKVSVTRFFPESSSRVIIVPSIPIFAPYCHDKTYKCERMRRDGASGICELLFDFAPMKGRCEQRRHYEERWQQRRRNGEKRCEQRRRNNGEKQCWRNGERQRREEAV